LTIKEGCDNSYDNSGKKSKPLVARRESQAPGGKKSSKGSKKSGSSINESFTLKKPTLSTESNLVEKKISEQTSHNSLN